MYLKMAGMGALGRPNALNGIKLGQADQSNGTAKTVRTVWAVLGTASMALSAYHGYKRNLSVGWAIWWAFMGALFPVLTPAMAIAQGFGKRALPEHR